MPWKEVTAMDEKKRFIDRSLQWSRSFRELCKEFGISTKTGYKYLKNYKEFGFEGLNEKDRTPHSLPKKTSASIENLIIMTRQLHPAWAGEKIKYYLIHQGYKKLPCEKTIDRILKRNGLITIEESEKHQPWKRFEHEHPNDLWQMDFKGHFAVGLDRCYPLTLLDDHSRYSLLIKACTDQKTETVQKALVLVFRNNGLPLRMTMDNGSPWGFSGKQQHTTLTAWLIRLGIYVSHSRPGHPQTQGKLERLHRTLNLELLSEYQFESLSDTQEGFDWWRKMYNNERPHAAIGHQVPSSRYYPSHRIYPEELPQLKYDSNMIIRKVQQDGTISFKGNEYRIGQAFKHNPVGLNETEDDGIWDVYFAHQRVVKIDLRYPCSK